MIKDRIELAEHFNTLGFKVGAEIGVADGRYSEILCQKISGLKLICIDPWVKYDGNWRSNDYQNKAHMQANNRLSKYDATLIKGTGLEVSNRVDDQLLDFVFIDGDHTFDNVMLDIILWSRKVKKGGIVAGHDYYQLKAGGIIPAVNAYVEAHKIDLNLTMRNPGGHKDDQVPCWWFVKK